LDRRLGGTHSLYGRGGEDKKSLSCPWRESYYKPSSSGQKVRPLVYLFRSNRAKVRGKNVRLKCGF